MSLKVNVSDFSTDREFPPNTDVELLQTSGQFFGRVIHRPDFPVEYPV